MSELSLYDAFEIESPNANTKDIPVSAIVKVGNGTNRKMKPFVFDYKSIRRILRNINLQNPIWAHGPSGCGKTELYTQIGVRLNRPVHIISLGEETSLRELLGSKDINNSVVDINKGDEKGTDAIANALWTMAQNGLGVSTKFEYGHLTQAMQEKDSIIILDEFNMCPPGVAAQLNSYLETGSIAIPETGEVVHNAENVTVVVTSNTSGGVDETGLFNGSQAQNGATRSRFAYIQHNYLDEENERKIVINAIRDIDSVKTPGDAPFSKLVVDTARACRSLVDSGAVSLPFTVRNLLKFAQTTRDLHDLEDGFRDSYFDGLSQTEQVPVAAVFNKIFGISLLENTGELPF